MHFEFATAARIVFGRGQLDRLAEFCAPLGRRVLLIRGGDHLDRSGAISRVLASLANFELRSLTVRGEPEVHQVDAAIQRARQAKPDLVVGLGGGSVLDTAKAVAALLTHTGTALDYMEVVGRGQPLMRPAAPCIAIPTTAGTGTEVTKNAVIVAKAQQFKASIRSEYLLPRMALIDSSLTDTLPAQVTAATGLDTLTQLLEPLVSLRAQPFTDALGLEGLRRAARSLRRAFTDATDSAARDDMAMAALVSGICLANAGLGAVHGFAAPLGASYPQLPHGVACAALLPHVVRANLAALRARAPDSPALTRYAQAFRILIGASGSDEAVLESGVAHLSALVRDLEIHPLAAYGVTRDSLPELAARARQASSMRTNPIALNDPELLACLTAAL